MKSGSPARSLYIHIPFCSHKCHYCDFYSFVDTRDRQAVFADRLERELAALSVAAGTIDTIFVGGGTPSLLEVPLWEGLLRAMDDRFDLGAIKSSKGEFTVECNPESVTPELMSALRAGGVSRISMGAQSFQNEHLKTLERLHDPERVPRAVEMARAAGIDRVSLDLIFAIPGQTLDDLAQDLEAALSLPIEHISCYELTYEPNTAMTKRLEMGQFDRCPEELEIEMFEYVGKRTKAAGFERYEVSNYARPGAECRHNLAYWRQEQWLAAGPSASAHIAGHRYKNIPRLETYLDREDAGFSAIVDHEGPDPIRLIQEKLMTGLRLREGVAGGDLLRELGKLDAEAASRLDHEAAMQSHLGRLVRTEDRWMLTEEGLLLADGVASNLMVAILG
jgi:oxygen-independent coproporphyrinogen-3 oxidase